LHFHGLELRRVVPINFPQFGLESFARSAAQSKHLAHLELAHGVCGGDTLYCFLEKQWPQLKYLAFRRIELKSKPGKQRDWTTIFRKLDEMDPRPRSIVLANLYEAGGRIIHFDTRDLDECRCQEARGHEPSEYNVMDCKHMRFTNEHGRLPQDAEARDMPSEFRGASNDWGYTGLAIVDVGSDSDPSASEATEGSDDDEDLTSNSDEESTSTGDEESTWPNDEDFRSSEDEF
jgi:hypothetical protein